MHDDGDLPGAGSDLELLKQRLESLISGIIEDAGEIAEIIKKIKNSPSFFAGMMGGMPGVEKKLHDLKNLLRSIDGFDRVSSTMPLTLFPTPPPSPAGFTSINAYAQLPGRPRLEFNGPYFTLNGLFNQGLDLGTIVEFHSSSLAGMDACLTCAFVMIDAYMRSEAIDTKSVRFITAEPMRYGAFFKRLEPAIDQHARLDCIKVASIDTIFDARSLLENLALTIDVPKHGLVIINCVDTIIGLLGYDSMARRDRLKSALFQALRQTARDNDAIVVVTSLILGKPRQYERETYDYMASVEPQSAGCLKLRVLGRGQTYINRREDGFLVSAEPVAFSPPEAGAPVGVRGGPAKADDSTMARVEAFNALVLSMQEDAQGGSITVDALVEQALSRSVAASAEEALSLVAALKRMRLVADLGDGTITAAR
ncbi:MAG: hypothetical protein JW839_10835 [Candidatus Lokiarchaeota archaeon]|nr:hypothetical protein [Candidatus Lokiarchaeota archaeon]